MDKIVIHGGERLQGEVRINGAKNAVLLIQCAALLGEGKTTLRHVPRLSDVRTMGKLLERLGCQVGGDRTLSIDPEGVARGGLEAPYDLVKTMRASVTVMGPLLARYGRARVSLPGGCAIGARPIDQHLKGFAALGAEIELSHGYVELRARRLHGASVVFDTVTVGGTQNVMMGAVLARGTSRLENVAREPEVQELARFLNKMGARISGAGTPVIEIEGVDSLGGIDHAVVPDRIEAGTMAVAAAITRGDVLLRDAPVDDMHAVIAKLQEAGVSCDVTSDGLHVRGPEQLRPIDVTTRPYPGFPTDMQAQLMVLATQAHGQSLLTETIFENRFMHVPELGRMGADIHVNGNSAAVRGSTPLSGAIVMATDLRASASLVLAGLVADGPTEVRRVYHLDRGYEAIEKRLRGLGARIERFHGAPG
ncbi:UDP-N-acetylglucosamine 1-carboxyvinyltransferase [Paraliomyxa miuraensis]|uniref:UDP-N-acetylglucosamine 1-carboxyvinyltransferase n=1 Tax=Paraliomyxa miuraensis TaxID=376150 RepID=UPI0022581251|nr:UDP-N-acetylglucosamine 1-carboxyvinyltransferase [Paraliomyxa miuraensis]MCX4241119.1 UDP-N-acetylglucosamine 1-carboxyvinyltransferase [Paraliomyxa miuraensis]